MIKSNGAQKIIIVVGLMHLVQLLKMQEMLSRVQLMASRSNAAKQMQE